MSQNSMPKFQLPMNATLSRNGISVNTIRIRGYAKEEKGRGRRRKEEEGKGREKRRGIGRAEADG